MGLRPSGLVTPCDPIGTEGGGHIFSTLQEAARLAEGRQGRKGAQRRLRGSLQS
jgi:hypothetical protein